MIRFNWRINCSNNCLNAPFSGMDVLKMARTHLLPTLLTVGLGCFLISELPAFADGRQVIDKTRPAAAAQLASIGKLPGSDHLRLAIGLPLRNEAELEELLGQLYDPKDTNFRRWLTPEQLAERFGATEQDCQAVRHWALAHGLSVRATHPNRLVLDVEGSVADIESAFNVTLRTYNHPSESRTFFAPDAEPSVDLVVPLLSIFGLDNYVPPRPKHRIQPFDERNTIT